jgi:hypothetical protein
MYLSSLKKTKLFFGKQVNEGVLELSGNGLCYNIVNVVAKGDWMENIKGEYEEGDRDEGEGKGFGIEMDQEEKRRVEREEGYGLGERRRGDKCLRVLVVNIQGELRTRTERHLRKYQNIEEEEEEEVMLER